MVTLGVHNTDENMSKDCGDCFFFTNTKLQLLLFIKQFIIIIQGASMVVIPCCNRRLINHNIYVNYPNLYILWSEINASDNFLNSNFIYW